MKKKIAVCANGWNYDTLHEALLGIREYAYKEDFDIFVFLSFASYSEHRMLMQGELNIYKLMNPRQYDGIIVFSTDVNVLNGEEGIEKYKKKFSNLWKTIKNRVLKHKKLEQIRNLFNQNQSEPFYAYSVGHAFRGKYQGYDGKLYDEKSVTFEINGISSESLLKLAELVAKFFNQETVLVKDLNNNKIYLADAIPMNKTLDDALSELNAKCD